MRRWPGRYCTACGRRVMASSPHDLCSTCRKGTWEKRPKRELTREEKDRENAKDRAEYRRKYAGAGLPWEGV